MDYDCADSFNENIQGFKYHNIKSDTALLIVMTFNKSILPTLETLFFSVISVHYSI